MDRQSVICRLAGVLFDTFGFFDGHCGESTSFVNDLHLGDEEYEQYIFEARDAFPEVDIPLDDETYFPTLGQLADFIISKLSQTVAA